MSAALSFPELPAGREYLCIGPDVWARDVDGRAAIRKAKRENRGRAPWRFLLYDVPAGATVDGYGFGIVYDDAPNLTPARLILRFHHEAGR